MLTLNADDLIVGAAAGITATAPMTITMEQLHRVVPGEHDGPLPPREVTEELYEQFSSSGRAAEPHLQRMTVVLHYAFGGAAGALFPLVAPRALPPAIGAGILYGLAVWTGSYLGVLPALGIRHHAKHDSAGRNGIMIAAHVVWGATLALLLRGRPGLRAASRHPDSPQVYDSPTRMPLRR
jgi:uncharacterized membrane protein YagU involved in acid resistance